ncbi:MAG: CsbD family protein [Pseudomonadota bacterium]|nr:CsbD family protein [Pseudomonadota bacterium]
MDKNRQEGAKHQTSGAMKEGLGKVTGDHSKEAEGKIEKNAGKAQREVGKTADSIRDSDRNRH